MYMFVQENLTRDVKHDLENAQYRIDNVCENIGEIITYIEDDDNVSLLVIQNHIADASAKLEKYTQELAQMAVNIAYARGMSKQYLEKLAKNMGQSLTI